MLSIGGGANLQFYPNFALFSTLRGMNLDQDFFQVSKLSKLSEDFTRNGALFFPRIQVKTKKKVFTTNGSHFLSTGLRSDVHQSQIIGGDADEDHTQIVGGYTVKLLGRIYPPSSFCFGTTGFEDQVVERIKSPGILLLLRITS